MPVQYLIMHRPPKSVMQPPPKALKMAAAGARVFRPGIDANLQRFFDVHFAEIESDDDSIEFEETRQCLWPASKFGKF